MIIDIFLSAVYNNSRLKIQNDRNVNYGKKKESFF